MFCVHALQIMLCSAVLHDMEATLRANTCVFQQYSSNASRRVVKKMSAVSGNNSDPNSRYTKIKELGEGSFGHVWQVRSNYSFRTYVKKEMKERCNDGYERDAALNEANILARLKHKNIIRYRDAYFDDGRLCIIMEYADDGDLYTKIKKQNGRRFDSSQILNWFVQLVMAVKYIHDQNILHRDLKSQNIFLTLMGILKVGDFGISRLLECTSDHAKTVVGTPYYLSPEICRKESYNQKSDIWSLGVILYEITTLTYPFMGKTLSELISNILVGNFAPIESDASPLICDLVLILLQLDATNRPSATDILRIPAVAKITKDFMNKMAGDVHRKTRKESLNSPLIERKRDKSFHYDVIFDLTLSHDLNDPSSDNCKKSVLKSDLYNVADPNRNKPRHMKEDAKSSQRIDTQMHITARNIPAIEPDRTLVNDTASVFANIENMEENAAYRRRKKSDINRKRTFTLDRDAMDTAKVVKSRRSCNTGEQQKSVQDTTIDFYREMRIGNVSLDCQWPNIPDKSACNCATASDETEKPCRIVSYAKSKDTCYVESVGPVIDFSNLLVRVTDSESSTSKVDSHNFESNQQIADNISKDGIKAVGSTFIINELSPKIKEKVLGRARKFNSKNKERKNRVENKESENCNNHKEDSLPSSKQERESLPSQNHSDLSGEAGIVTKPSSVKEYINEFSKPCWNPEAIVKNNCKMEFVTKDVLIFVDDEEFLPVKDQNSEDIFIPNASFYGKDSLQQFTKQLEFKHGKMEIDRERMEKLQLILQSRLGEHELKIVCNFLRKRKLALLEDDVLSYVQQILGKEVDNLLPVMIEFLLLEKRLSQ